jgi:hypothetical protein
MSRSTALESHSSPVNNVAPKVQQNTPQLSPIYPTPGMRTFSRADAAESHGPKQISLPSLRQLSSTPPTPMSDRRPENLLGVRSILNPQADMIQQQRNRRGSGMMLESPSPVETLQSQSLPSLSRPTSLESLRDERLPPPPLPGRLPKRNHMGHGSPRLLRNANLGVLNPPTGTIDAHQSPFLSASTRPSDNAPSQPALPTPPVNTRVTYFTGVPPTAPTPPPGMFRTGDPRRSKLSFPQSGSASPIASFSPYSQAASVASSQFDSGSHHGSYAHMSNRAPTPDHNNPLIKMETGRGLMPMAPSGQGTIQMITIKSQQGHDVRIPVDVQAASKVADEKRKRNAGASARFRARRKEKEREASQSISRLEQQLRDALEDVDYYRCERDYFKAIVFQQPGAERHYARPPSPRLRRSSVAPSMAPSSSGGGSGSSYGGYDDEMAREPERNVRRRTSSYHPAAGPPPTQQHGPGHSLQSYAPTPFPSMHQPTDSPANRPLAPPPFDASQRPVLRDPFAADASRYENRPWAVGPGQEHRR